MVVHKIPDFPRSEVDLTTQATRRIATYLPLASAPMDTVTEYMLAIKLELLGGIGFLHYNYADPKQQIEQMRRVKCYKAAFVIDPVCLRPNDTVADVYGVNEKHGFFSVPITEDGTPHKPILGFVSHRDVRYIEDRSTELRAVMTPHERLITAHRKDTMDKKDIKAANAKIRKHNLDTLIIIDNYGRPCALVTDRDIRLHDRYPKASVDSNKRLYGFAAIKGDWHNPKRRGEEIKRIEGLADAGADGLVIDQGVVYASQTEIVKYVKSRFPDIQIGVGNISCGVLVKELMEAAGNLIDFIKVGVSPGTACKTLQYLGVGRDQPSAVHDCVMAMKSLEKKYGKVPIWADGGVRCPGDATKALALGANVVMVGSVLAGAEEAPGKKTHKGGGKWVKEFRGMGSLAAMQAGGDARYSFGSEKIQVEEGKVLEIPIRGPAEELITEFEQGIRQSMNKQGFRSIKELQEGCWLYPHNETPPKSEEW